MSAASRPLEGLRVLDLTRLLPGPVASLHLADLGAEVIKIEDPEIGDYARTLGASNGAMTDFFRAINRNKRFVTLDLKKETDREAFFSLVASADALLESFRPGVMDRLGCGYEALHTINPRLVYCSITGYGQRGPYSAQPGHDVNYLGYTGVLAQTADVNGRPVLPGIQIADLLGGSLTGAMTILAALIGAAKSGTGCHLDVSMTDSVYAHSVMLNAEVSQSGATGSPSNGLLTGGVACYNVYETGDGRYLAVGALEAKFWDSLCDAIDRVDLKPRHWSRGETPGSDAAVDAIAQLAREFKREDLSTWVARLEMRECCVSPVLRADEAARHPLFTNRGMVVTAPDPVEGGLLSAAFPALFSGERPELETGARPAGYDNPLILPRRPVPSQ